MSLWDSNKRAVSGLKECIMPHCELNSLTATTHRSLHHDAGRVSCSLLWWCNTERCANCEMQRQDPGFCVVCVAGNLVVEKEAQFSGCVWGTEHLSSPSSCSTRCGRFVEPGNTPISGKTVPENGTLRICVMYHSSVQPPLLFDQWSPLPLRLPSTNAFVRMRHVVKTKDCRRSCRSYLGPPQSHDGFLQPRGIIVSGGRWRVQEKLRGVVDPACPRRRHPLLKGRKRPWRKHGRKRPTAVRNWHLNGRPPALTFFERFLSSSGPSRAPQKGGCARDVGWSNHLTVKCRPVFRISHCFRGECVCWRRHQSKAGGPRECTNRRCRVATVFIFNQFGGRRNSLLTGSLGFFSLTENRSVRYTSDAVLGARRWPHHWSVLVVRKLRKGSKKRTRGTRTLWLFRITNSEITAFRSPVCCGCGRLGTRVRRFDAGVFVGLYCHAYSSSRVSTGGKQQHIQSEYVYCVLMPSVLCAAVVVNCRHRFVEERCGLACSKYRFSKSGQPCVTSLKQRVAELWIEWPRQYSAVIATFAAWSPSGVVRAPRVGCFLAQ